jgi:hypothetical protein
MNVTSLIKRARKVQAGNEAFKKLSKPEKRVAVAKDAIAQLLVGAYRAKPGTYVKISDGLGLESVFGQGMPQCNVCGIGSALLSEFRLSGRKDGLDSDTDRPNGVFYYNGENTKVFSEKMLRAMERAFELEGKYPCGDYNCTTCKPDVIAYIDNAEARLYAVLQNIVDNDGAFKAKLIDPRDEAAKDKARKAGKKITEQYAKLKVKALEANAKLAAA